MTAREKALYRDLIARTKLERTRAPKRPKPEKIVPPSGWIVTCHMCNGYQLVPDAQTNLLVRCPECHPGEHCPVHLVGLEDGMCRRCLGEAEHGVRVICGD